MLTARADEETKMAALSAGASDFLPKPFSTTELNVRIKNLVESHRSQRKLSRQKQQLESTLEELKETEVELVRAEKMSSLGVVAAGLMHEIRNALNYPRTNIYGLKSKASQLPPEERQDYLDALEQSYNGISRVVDLTQQLQKFAHPRAESCDHVDLAEAVQSALLFTSNKLKEVHVECHLVPGQTIWANRNNLVQVLMNLLLNSADALKEKQFVNGDMPTIWVEGREEKGLSVVCVRDNGTGIKKKDVDKIYDPFFTTKDVGKGTGLGLSICYRIVEAYDGRISVRTEPGEFCEFTLEFPVKG
jgi:C4-dicarboxylate-specific signal transduction histidine kinase